MWYFKKGNFLCMKQTNSKFAATSKEVKYYKKGKLPNV